MKDAWGAYMILSVLSKHPLVIKGASFAPGKRKGAKGSFTKMVENASQEIASKNWKEVVLHLENANSHIQEVDWDSEKIWILGEDSPRRFKTVQNILAKL